MMAAIAMHFTVVIAFAKSSFLFVPSTPNGGRGLRTLATSIAKEEESHARVRLRLR